MPKTAVVVPAYNAANTLGDLVTRISRNVREENIFVVDDGSSDRTEFVAREKGVWVLRHASRRGKGSALGNGTRKALELGYDLIITIDSDLQHDPDEIPVFITASEHFDVVVGERSVSTSQMPVHRFLSNSITSGMITLRTGVKIKDSQCGYRLYRAEVLRSINSKATHFDYESDILIKSALAGFRIGSVPIRTIYNNSFSSMRFVDVARFVRVFLKSYTFRYDKDKSSR